MKKNDVVQVINPVSFYDGLLGTVTFVFGVTVIVNFDGKEAQFDIDELDVVETIGV